MKQFKNIWRLICIIFAISKKNFALNLILIIMRSVAPIINILLSSMIIQRLVDHQSASQITVVIGVLVITNFLFSISTSFLRSKVTVLNKTLKDDFILRIGKKIMELQYGKLENPYLLDLKQQALMPIIEWGTFEYLVDEFIPTLIGSIITITTTIALIGNYNLVLLIPITITMIVNLILSKIKNERFQKVMMNVGLVERKIGYFSIGKDIRIFGMDKIIMKKIKELNDKEITAFSKLFYKAAFLDFWETVSTQIQIYIIYFFVAFQLLKKSIAIGDFFRITGLFINFGNATFSLLNSVVNLRARSNCLEKFIEFEDLQVYQNQNDEEEITESADIDIKNLSFVYENSDKEVLTDINLHIEKGKRVALVGENGSGKTTLVNLISGLLQPSKGEILINNEKISGDRRKSISTVFQDFKLFSFSISENIKMSYKKNKNIFDMLDKVGMLNEIKSLPQSENTHIYKNFSDDGVELSIGQGQKLAIARSLYKDSGIIILDEPTAALDPKAEFDIFMNFRDITSGKTSILVSHRLSSCAFCDSIVVLENGQIIEQGTHEELMKKENGKYKKMFEAQAKFYK